MIKDDSGRIALESALLFPLLLMFTIGSLFAALAAGIHGVQLTEAGLAASRASFVWDNSHRNPITGDFYPGQYDGLYWRLIEDHGGSGLTERKLDAALSAASFTGTKQGAYRNRIWQREVIAAFTAPIHAPLWAERMMVSRRKLAGSESISIVVDPAEWVRTIELARVYWPVVERTLSKEKANQIVDAFRKRYQEQDGPLVFDTHNEARAYLQQLVNGRLSRESTEEVGEWRLIDALDRYGIAHQAYFGMKKNDKDMRDQLLKDAELIRKGKVNGVTWHFFRRSKDGEIGLSDSLRHELEGRGIVIVVHE